MISQKRIPNSLFNSQSLKTLRMFEQFEYNPEDDTLTCKHTGYIATCTDCRFLVARAILAEERKHNVRTKN